MRLSSVVRWLRDRESEMEGVRVSLAMYVRERGCYCIVLESERGCARERERAAVTVLTRWLCLLSFSLAREIKDLFLVFIFLIKIA